MRAFTIVAAVLLLAAPAVASAQTAAPAATPGGAECAVGGVSGIAPPETAAAGGDISLVSVNEAASKMICLCGCGNMVLSDCECGEAVKDKQKIRALLSEGKSPEQVVAVFVSAEGERRLAAPTKKGFNLVVWVAPFVALLLGGTFLTFVLRSWTRRKPPGVTRGVSPLSKEDRERLDEELRRGA